MAATQVGSHHFLHQQIMGKLQRHLRLCLVLMIKTKLGFVKVGVADHSYEEAVDYACRINIVMSS